MVIYLRVALIIGEAAVEPNRVGTEKASVYHDGEEDTGDTDSVIFLDVLPGHRGAGMPSPVIATGEGGPGAFIIGVVGPHRS
jgi:hypothetical protein